MPMYPWHQPRQEYYPSAISSWCKKNGELTSTMQTKPTLTDGSAKKYSYSTYSCRAKQPGPDNSSCPPLFPTPLFLPREQIRKTSDKQGWMFSWFSENAGLRSLCFPGTSSNSHKCWILFHSLQFRAI